METIWQDVKYALRTLAKNPGFTAVVVLTLALGIGANSAVFSVINPVLLRPLPYSNPNELVSMTASNLDRKITGIAVSFTKFSAVHDQSHALSAVAAFFSSTMTLTAQGEPQSVPVVRVSSDFFRVLGTSLALGRDFLPKEDQPGGADVAIISDGFWHSHLGGDPSVLGKTLTLDGTTMTIIGVLSPSFRFPFQQPEPDVWIPRVFEMGLLTPVQIHSGAGFLSVIGRMRPGITMARLQAEIDTIHERYIRDFPGVADGEGHPLVATTLEESLVGTLRPSLLVLLATVGFVLLIACANVASLLVARATAREKEIAIRRAMGASHLRLVRQLLTESLILAFVGGALGIVLAAQALPLLSLVAPGTIPRVEEIHLDGAVLLYSFLLCCVTGVAFGLVPALQASRRDLHDRLKEGARGTTGGAAGGQFRRALVMAEVAVALLLVTGSGLLLRSFVSLMHVNPGFEPSHLLTFSVSLPTASYPESQQQADFYRRLLDEVRVFPRVDSATVVTYLPLAGAYRLVYFCPEGLDCQGIGKDPLIALKQIGTDYFRTMRTQLRGGRVFTDQDTVGTPNVVIINQTVALRHFPGQNPVGKHLMNSRDRIPREIVGVVANVKFNTLNAPDAEEMYLPMAQMPWPAMSLVIRSASDPQPLVTAVRQTLNRLDSNLPLTNIQTMDEIVSASVAQPKLVAGLVGVFGALALLLAAVGIYGVMSYSVTLLTQEIGIRMALGAQPADIFRRVVGQGMRLVAIGLTAGFLGALLLTRLLEGLLFGVTATDPLTFGGVALLLCIVALSACYLPARRAMQVDPLIALRHE